mgnify:CR=1 FL=1
MNQQIAKACSILGSQANLANHIGVSPAAVNQWVSGHRPVPMLRCIDIERATGGAVTRRDLRPDDWHRIWPELADGAGAIQVEEAA